jgi:glycosyltransferase involved in cell wall biosynthesis
VSVIVSLYKAAAKLGLFLRTLERQTLAAQGGMELVLVDSGSPTDEYAAFRQWAEGAALPVVYARSRQRETIQSAWNRGIALSRAPYLTFLGVDEAILPECLEALAKELDADPALDWVQANSLVTAVDVHGTLHEDVMLYDRRGYRPGLVYLETCYLSWVAALYRRSIHDRFGYYDASFTAAGDTEFKNRVLPHVKTGAVCRTLGIFRNYPEERTTAHPRAEIEDLRAWYLHRTAGGAAYAYDGRDVAEVEEQLYAALSYRKSYLKRLSSDVEYASQLGRYLRWRAPDSPALRLMPGVERLLRTYRALDALRPDRGTGNFLPLGLALSRMRAVRRQHWGLGREGWAPEYGYLNDNRQEQHFWAW